MHFVESMNVTIVDKMHGIEGASLSLVYAEHGVTASPICGYSVVGRQ